MFRPVPPLPAAELAPSLLETDRGHSALHTRRSSVDLNHGLTVCISVSAMNILFRKHFHGEPERSYGKVGGKVGKAGHGKRSRESGYTVMEEHHYRTHIFLSPTGGGCQGCFESEPMTQRRPSVTLMKWAVGGVSGGNRRKQSGRTDNTSLTVSETPNANRQVSFSNGGRQGAITSPSAAQREPVTLATLNKDCFIIPVASLDRFLPAGVPVS